jgi:hypothetical protein
MADYRATPEQWVNMEKYGSNIDGGYAACILELRARVEALEANSSARLTGSNYPEKPDGSLVERVAGAIAKAEHLCDAEDALPEARAAIREVAAWMASNPDHYFPPALVFTLEQQVEE